MAKWIGFILTRAGSLALMKLTDIPSVSSLHFITSMSLTAHLKRALTNNTLFLQSLWQEDENVTDDISCHLTNIRHSYNTVTDCRCWNFIARIVLFQTGPARMQRDPHRSWSWGNECSNKGWQGIRAGCPLWCPCWTHVSLSGCCCGQEALRGREPEGPNESSSWVGEREQKAMKRWCISLIIKTAPYSLSSLKNERTRTS